jgi:hypothetical protein
MRIKTADEIKKIVWDRQNQSIFRSAKIDRMREEVGLMVSGVVGRRTGEVLNAVLFVMQEDLWNQLP